MSTNPTLSRAQRELSDNDAGNFSLSMARIVRVPRVPNFLFPVEGSESIAVGDVNNDQLKQIGAAWTTALLNNAERQRKDRKAKAELRQS